MKEQSFKFVIHSSDMKALEQACNESNCRLVIRGSGVSLERLLHVEIVYLEALDVFNVGYKYKRAQYESNKNTDK